MHIQKSIFKHFQKYLGIFRDFHAYSVTLTGAYLGEGEEASTALFKNRKTCPDFWNEGHDCSHIWVKFFIQNVVLRLSKREKPKMFPCGASFLVFLMKFVSKCPRSTNLPPPPEKFLVAHLHSGFILFAKRFILKFWQCPEYVSLDNCSVICTVTLCN